MDCKAHLLGGSKATGNAGANLPEDEDVYASFELHPDAPEKSPGISSWTGHVDSEYAVKPPVITDLNATLGMAK